MPIQPSTPVTIPATKAHRQFAELIRRAFLGKEHFVVEKDGLPVVAIIPMAEYQEFLAQREREEQEKQARVKRFEEAARAIGEEIAKTGMTEEELMDKVEEVRQRRYEERHGVKSTE